MTFSEFERVLNHCPHFTNFWLFLRVGEFCLFVLLTSRNFGIVSQRSSLQFTIEKLTTCAVKLEIWHISKKNLRNSAPFNFFFYTLNALLYVFLQFVNPETHWQPIDGSYLPVTVQIVVIFTAK